MGGRGTLSPESKTNQSDGFVNNLFACEYTKSKYGNLAGKSPLDLVNTIKNYQGADFKAINSILRTGNFPPG
jgi:hypothetical protein